jgi:Spy/CpxP family protein refolding chaperone
MKKRNIIILTTILAVGTLVAAPLVIAGPHGHGHGPGPGLHGDFGVLAHLRHAKEELGLSDQQVEQIKAVFDEAHEANAGSREQMHDGIREAAEILLANPNDIAGAQAVLDRQAATERALKTNILNATAKAFAVLNADQRAKLRTMLDEHVERRGGLGR